MRALAQAALDAQFEAPGFADDAEWLTGAAAATGETNCRIKPIKVEDGWDAGEMASQLIHEQYWVNVRVSDVATVQRGDRFVTSYATFRVVEQPRKPGTYRLKWQAKCEIVGAPGG